MPRTARIVIPGVTHHVTQRGNRRQTVFFNDEDYRYYLKLLFHGATVHKTQIIAYCLMPNHVHLLLAPPHEDALATLVGEIHKRYARRINSREGWTGHLWQGRFASFPMDEPHLYHAIAYVLNNPVRAGLVDSLERWNWSGPAEMLAKARRFTDNDDIVDVIRKHIVNGLPLGTTEFIKELEQKYGRSMTAQKPGPKPQD